MKPTTKELDRIKHLAHRAYGYVLTNREADAVYHIAWTDRWYRPMLLPKKPYYNNALLQGLRAIAAGHRETWELVK